MQGFRARATAGREEGLPQSPRSARAVAAGARIFRRRCPFSLMPRSPGASLSRCPVTPLSRSPSASAFSAYPRAPKQAFLESRTWENTPPCPKTCHFGFPSPGKRTSVPQNRSFWGPEAGNSTLPLGKTGVFAHPRTENRPLVGQNRHFCPSEDEKQAFRWAKPAFLPIRGRKYSSSLGKTGIFAHPRLGKHPFVGQNRRFCPSAGGQGRTRQQEMASFGWGYVPARRAGYSGRHTGGRIENIFAGDVNDSHICA